MAIIKKKAWPEMFQAVLNGEKKFDLRLADEEVNKGDILILEEYDPEIKQYTGRKIEKKVGFILKTKDMKFWIQEDIEKYGFVVFSID